MDIKESFRRILEQKQAVTHRLFTVALGGGHETRFIFFGTEGAGQSVQLPNLPQPLSVPLAIYAQFTNDLLRTLQEFHGAEWNAELREQWRVAIERVGRALFAVHEKSLKG